MKKIHFILSIAVVVLTACQQTPKTVPDDIESKKPELPYANEENLIAHFEKLLNDKDPALYENAVKELRADLGQYMKKHFTLFEYQKKYFDRRTTSELSYYSRNHKKAWNEFWDESVRLLRKRNAISKAHDREEVKFTPKLPPDSMGTTILCKGVGVTVDITDDETETALAICLGIFAFVFRF